MRSAYGPDDFWQRVQALRRSSGERTLEEQIRESNALAARKANEAKLVDWCNERLRKLGERDLEVVFNRDVGCDYAPVGGVYIRDRKTKLARPEDRNIDVYRLARNLGA